MNDHYSNYDLEEYPVTIEEAGSFPQKRLGTFTFLLSILIVFIIGWSSHSNVWGVVAGICAICLICGMAILISLKQNYDIFSVWPLFGIMTILQFGLNPAIHLATDVFGIEHGPNVYHQMTVVLFSMVLALLMAILGYLLPVGAYLSRFIPKGPDEIDWEKSKLLIIILCFLGLFGFLLLFFALQSAFKTAGGSTASYLSSGLGLILQIIRFAGIAVLFAALRHYWSLRLEGYGRQTLLIFSLLVVISMQVLLGSRNQIAWIVLFVLIIRHKIWKQIQPTVILLGFLLSSFVFLTMGYMNDVVLPKYGVGLMGEDLNYGEYLSNRFVGFYIGEFGRFEDAMAVINNVPDKTTNYTYGRSYLMILPIPRAIWKSKPNFGQMHMNAVFGPGRFESMGTFTYSRAACPLSEAYMNFGYIGIILHFFAMGILFKAIDTYRKYCDMFYIGPAIAAVNMILVLHASMFAAYLATTYYLSLLIPLVLFSYIIKGQKLIEV